ncbi:conserved exported hypothetical protein [Flavobacterium sp. 9AF]|uniref:hypothetical protein n=1 Tax=Flavobacterium sp. 9AF TaxID=2653142 RepID=UPI0012F12529|nr:hypothetical protein [Flavobacterium sp. 9AF]VXC25713.1 conserved exported hypothetical protein [Flavobacterium sp. 9AF]
MRTFKIKIALSFLVLFTSCKAIQTAVYDQYSYQKTTELKVETLLLMDNAVTPYPDQQEKVEKILLDMEKLKEYEKNKPNNEITFSMWSIMTNSEKNLVSGFFKRWKEKQNLSPAFVIEAKKQIEEAYNLLIEYEVKKDKTSKDNLLAIISQ